MASRSTPQIRKASPGAAVAQLLKTSAMRPTLAIVLGSGFHETSDAVEIESEIPYRSLPGFPRTSVAGHSGRLLVGRLGGTPVVVLCGRVHYYEGWSMEEVTFPIRVLAMFGIQTVLLTNAAGGINRRLRVGEFMLLTDHINLMGANPLRRFVGRDQERFVDLSQTYDPALGSLMNRAARATGAALHSGVYLAVTGPSYETPAEIRAFARLGADAVGMSTVPEVVVARQCGLRVAALSCITNLAAGRTKITLSHSHVLSQTEKMKTTGARLLKTFAKLHGEHA